VSTEPDIWARLAAPFALDELEWRVGATTKAKDKGMCLVYVTNRAIMERLDDVVGPPNWRPEFLLGRGKSVLCGLALRIDGEWIVKWDGAEETDTEPVKGGISGAMKRAAVQWGIGRYLYAMPDFWAPLENGKYFPRDWRPPIPAAFLPAGSPPPASPPPVKAKPAPKPKAQQAKPGPPPWWDEPVGLGTFYSEMSWRDAWEMDRGEFKTYLEAVVKETLEEFRRSKRKATEDEKRANVALGYLGGMK